MAIEAKGKTVDEAIFNGLNEMGLSLDEVNIEVLHEGSKGFFGIGKSALVRLEKKVVQAAGPVQFLDGLFEKMGVQAKSNISSDEDGVLKIDVEGRDTAVLIGRRGDTLDSIQYLTGLVINRGKDGYTKVMLDAENYRNKREITLEKLAKRLANTVSKTGKPITLEPMNPYERRILHATLQNNPRVMTYSEGEEPYRRVVVKRKGRGEQDGQYRGERGDRGERRGRPQR